MRIHGLHHVTAVTGEAAENVRFYTQALGMRLVKKTVNQDDVSAYHLFYGDEVGRAGTEMTFFDWPAAGPNLPGAGSLTEVGLRVAGRAALEWWVERLSALMVPHSGVRMRAGRATVTLSDPEGQRLVLADDGGAPGGTPWAQSPVPQEHGIRGLDSITILLRNAGPTARALTQALGFRQAGAYEADGRQVTIMEVGDGGPGAEVHLAVDPALTPGRVGIGGVHHVALRTPDEDEQRFWQRRLAGVGLRPTPVIDRFYFRSVYCQIPGGALFEIATDGPGFATDEPTERLGERLSLPPFLEPQRAQIEAGLRGKAEI
jgi:glyoxalase family protein